MEMDGTYVVILRLSLLVTYHVWRERGIASGASRCLPSYHGLTCSLPHPLYILPITSKISFEGVFIA